LYRVSHHRRSDWAQTGRNGARRSDKTSRSSGITTVGSSPVCGAVLDTAEVLANPHLRERGAVYDIDHPTRGQFSVIGCPVRLSDSPFAPTRAPLMGEHSEKVLTSLAGFSADEVRALREKRVI
jgi:crotonobetainyl-CoA:carnitine CoA-transferase CaiB-like acyl-CoA transferase